MGRPNVIALELRFDRHEDGRVHIHSPDLPGLHLAGMNVDALRGDLESVLRDLLKANAAATVERLHFFPNLGSLTGTSATAPKRETCVVTLKEGS
jgi:hypothetical protein